MRSISLSVCGLESDRTRLRLMLYLTLDHNPRAIKQVEHSEPCFNYYLFIQPYLLSLIFLDTQLGLLIHYTHTGMMGGGAWGMIFIAYKLYHNSYPLTIII